MTLPRPFFQLNQSNPPPQRNFQKRDFQRTFRSPNKRNFNHHPPAGNNVGSYCKYCQIGFPTDNELFQHRRSHEKCPYDDCKFSANPATIANHIQKVHMKTSSLVKIQDLTTPEEIEKWREERRKRYPTTQNVVLRQKIQEEKIKRGEKLHDSKRRFGDNQQRDFVKSIGKRQNNKNFQPNDNRNQNKGNNQGRNKRQRQNDKPRFQDRFKKDETKGDIKLPAKPQQVLLDEEDSSEDEHPAVKKFKGTSQMKDYHESVATEETALSLLGMYGSDSDSCEDEDVSNIEPFESKSSLESTASNSQELSHDESIKINENETEEQMESENTSEIESRQEFTNEEENEVEENNIDEDSSKVDDEDEAPDEIPTAKQTEVPDSPSKNRKRKRSKGNFSNPERKITRRTGLDYSKLKSHRSVNPFLEKLLERDIVHERNALLQCVNFVVKNNFFGVGQSNVIDKSTIELKEETSSNEKS